jgi:pimeloyl-ACP methyl ester carboxylesterase
LGRRPRSRLRLIRKKGLLMNEEQTLDLRGTSLRILRAGRGEPVLFLHGGAGFEGLGPALRTLSQRNECIAPQHPGFGGSAVPPWLDRVADLANFYLDLIAQQGLRGVHLVGHDLGGWIAAEMAVRNTSALSSLTLVSSQGLHVPGVETADVFLGNHEQVLRKTLHDPALVKQLLEAPQTEKDAEVRIRDREIAARLTWQPRGHDPHLAKWLHRIDIPTLVVWGELDQLLPPAIGQGWRERISGAELAVIPQCGHAPHLERPDAFAQAFQAFLSSRRSAA